MYFHGGSCGLGVDGLGGAEVFDDDGTVSGGIKSVDPYSLVGWNVGKRQTSDYRS